MPYVTRPTPEVSAEIRTGTTLVGAIIRDSKYNVPQKFNLAKFNNSDVVIDASLIFAGVVEQQFNRQPYNRGLSTIGATRVTKNRLYIEIADNASYTDSTEYITKFVDAGEQITVEHPFSDTGTYYIKMQAENENGVFSEILEYTITVIILEYFIQEPNIKTQGPQANTVTVASPTASYTADNAPTSDEVVHRYIEIDEGDASVCQTVAEKLLSRWSSEQMSISGQINLNVRLKFKEKLHIINDDINLDEVLVLQKKSHDVTGRTTNVTAGDIILDDNELLTRILDELE